MANKKRDYLSFDRGESWENPALVISREDSLRRQRELEEQRRLEEEAKAKRDQDVAQRFSPQQPAPAPMSLDQFGRPDQLREALSRPTEPVERKPEAPTSDVGAALRGIKAMWEQEAIDDEFSKVDKLMSLGTPEARENYRTRLLSSSPSSMSEAARASHEAYVQNELRLIAEAEQLANDPAALRSRVQSHMQKAQRVAEESKRVDDYLDSTNSWLTQTGIDVIGGYKNFLSTLGGVAGGTVGAGVGKTPTAAAAGAKAGAAVTSLPQIIDAYQAEYAAAGRDLYAKGQWNEKTRDEAQARAFLRAAGEGASEIILGGLAGRMGLTGAAQKLVERNIASNVGRGAARTSMAATAEGFGETATTAGMDAVDQLYARSVLKDDPNDPTAKFIRGQVPRKADGSLDTEAYRSDLFRVFRGGAAAAGAISAVQNVAQVRADNKNLLIDMAGNGLDRNYGKTTGDTAPTTAIDPRPSQDLFGTPEGLPSVEEYQTQRQEQNLADAQLTIEQRKQSEQRAREQEIAYMQREIAQIKKNSTPYTLQQDFQRVQELENKLASLQPQPTQQETEPAPTQAEPVQEDMFPLDNSQLIADANAEAKERNKKVTEVPSTRSQAAIVEEAETSDAPLYDPAEVLGKLKAKQQERNNTLKMEGNKPVIQESNDPDVISTVFNLIKSKINTEKGATIGRLMAAGKVKIVDRLPNGAAGEYDGNTAYISAEHILENDGNFFAAVVDVAGHEVKHGVDVAGSKATLDSRSNDAIIKGLHQAAMRGDEDAISAWALATGQSDADLSKVKLGIPTNKTKRLELAARGINYANAKAQQSGRLESIGRGTLSRLRTTYKKMTGQSYNVNINDLDYLAKRMLKDVALKDVNIQGDIAAATGESPNALPMTISGGATAREQLKNNRTWLSVDGARKYEISDKDSSVQIPPEAVTGQRVPLDSVLNHEKLYTEFPEMRDWSVEFAPVEGGGGYTDLDEKTIVIDSRDPLFEGEVTAGKYKYDGVFHKYMLHEAQHAAQLLGGTTNGSNPDFMLSPEGKQAKASLDFIEQSGDTRPAVQAAREKARAVYDVEMKKADARYRAVLGEREAYRTGATLPLTEEELDLIGKGQQEAEWAAEPEGILSPRGKRISKKPALAMAASTRKALPKATKRDDTLGANTWRGIKRLLGSYSGHEEQLVKAGTAGKGESSALSYEAEYLAKTANHAIQAAISQSKSSRADVMKKVTEAIESSNANGGSETQRARMLKSQLDQAFPNTGLGDAFNAMRAFKWKMSQDLVDFRLRDKRLMDTKEVNIYTKAMTEAEKWTTRAYLNDLDKGYAKRFLKNAEKNPDSEDRRKLEAGIDWLVNNSLLIPDDQALEETNLGNLQRMLSNWDASEAKDLKKIKDTDERREAMIARLVELREMGGDNARTKAMAIIEDMLMTKGSNTFVGKEVRGMKQNRTVLEARAQLPSELREVLGEVTDPFLREAISLARLTGLVGQTKALTQIYEEGADKFYSTTSNGNFKFPLEGAAFGPLAGMYVNKDTKDFLGSYVATLGQYDTTLQEALETPRAGWQLAAQGVGKAIGAVAGQAKVAGVVLNMGNMAMNLAGAPLYAVANGVNPKHYWSSFRTAMDIARGNVARIQDPVRRAEAEEVLRAQAVDSAAVQEMRGGPWKLIEGEIDKATGKGMWARAWKAKGRPQEAAAEIYAAMDVWTKIASYKQNKEFLTEYNRLENKGWTPEQIEQEAGLQANRTNISWSAAIPIVKFAEQNVPWLTAFATYKTEVVRSTAMMGKSILQDIALAKNATTPEAKSLASQRAAARFFGTMISVVAPVAITVSNLIAESDEEKEKREAFAEWDKNRIQVYLGKDANGREHFFNFNRLDPKGVVNDALTDVWQGIGEGKGLEAMEKAVTGLFFGQFGRFVGAHTLLNDIAAATWGKPFKDKKDPQTLISGTKVDNFLRDYVGLGADVGVNTERLVQDMFVPGQMTVALDKDVLNIVEGNKTAASWLKGLGLKGTVQDPDKMVKNAGWEYQREVSKLKEKSKKLLEKSTSEEAKIEDLLDLVAKEQEAFFNLQKKTNAYDAFDAPQFIEGKKQGVKAKRTFGQAAELLMSDAGGGLAKKDISKLQSGKFVSGILTDDLIKTYEETLLSKLDRNSPTYNEEKQDAKSRAALLRQVYLEKKKENK